MSRQQFFALIFTVLAGLTTAQADDDFLDDRFYVAPFGTYVHGGGNRNSFDGWGGGMGIGKIINEHFNIEVKGFWQQFNGRPRSMDTLNQDLYRYNADFTGGTIDLQYFFFRDAFSPYVVAGVGGMNTSLRFPQGPVFWPYGPGGWGNQPEFFRYSKGSGNSTASFIFETGLGATYEILDNFLLRADVRYRLDTWPTSINAASGLSVFNDLLVNVGFMVPLGDKPTKVAAVAPVDDCATKDDDHDGVNNCDDKCPGTAKGTKVDEYGCPIKIELKGVNFNFDSPELTETAKTILNKVANDLSVYPLKKTIEVRGFASLEKESQAEHNLRLSQRRSESVVNYLKSRGVANKMIAKGFGTAYPIADNSTEAGRIKNRRVELVWVSE